MVQLRLWIDANEGYVPDGYLLAMWQRLRFEAAGLIGFMA
jgi:hypothetical protein